MMQQAGGAQTSEARHPSSPRGAPASGNNGNIPNFSLLGQQLYGVNPMMAPGQNFNQSHQFMNQQMMQVPNSGGVAQASQAVQSGLGMQPSHAGLSAESIMNALASIQQVVLQLQAMVPYWAQQNQQFPNVAFQQQAAAAISQIAQVAANMAQQQPQSQQQQQQPQSQQQQQNMSQQQQQQQNMSQQQQQQNMSQQQQQNMSQQQQQHNMACVPQTPISDSQQQQQLSQLFGASVTPAFNFFQQNGSATGNNNSGGNGGLASNFPALQGGSTGVSVEMGTTATSLANQMAAIDGGVSGNSTSGAGQGLGAPPKSTVPNGGQTFVGGQVGSNHGPSVASNISSGMVVRSKNGSPRSNNQIGSATNRGGTVPGMARDMSHMISNRSVNSGGMTASPVDDHDVGGARDDDDDGDGENLVPGSYDLVEMEAIEILAEHTHFCEICTKGFKRDANLRMHMRGHGDEYKTPAALARPDKASNEMTVVRQKRFSCPYVGCKRNKKHRKFQPLKTMLCVKNHYRRSHCPKILTCQKCKTKKFSVVADLKTHEKHCGCDKWQCSCGTTFSRKDKLFGHIGLFAGHTPAMNFNDVDGAGALDVSDVNGGPGNPSSMSSPGNDAAGFGLSGGGNLNSGNASSMSLGGGSGMGLDGNGLQGMTSRGGNPGGGSLNMSRDGNAMAPENSSSSDSFPSTGLIAEPVMLHSLFTNKLNKFYQTTSGGNSSSDGLH